MANQPGALLQGIRYQHLYSWFEVLSLLDADSPYEHAFVEHPDAGSADDVTLHARSGAGRPSRFVQVKYHVDHRSQYTAEGLVSVESGIRSLLQKLFESWRMLREEGPVEVWLVSNWTAAPQDLGRFLHEHKFKEELFGRGRPALQIRRQWRSALDTSEENLQAFCRDLRLRLGFGEISELEQRVEERMARLGLRTGTDALALAVDEVSRWIESGGESKRVARDSLLSAIERLRLRASAPGTPAVSLWVHGWDRQSYGSPPTVELDWTSRFKLPERTIPTPAVWDRELRPALEGARAEFSARPDGRYVDVRGRLPLTAALLIGRVFAQAAGFTLRFEQDPGSGRFWRSDAPPSDARFVVPEGQELGTPGRNLLVALCVTGDGWPDVQVLYRARPDQFSAVLCARPGLGVGPRAIASDADAVALAESAKDLIRLGRVKYAARNVHLIVFGPAGWALFLGQRLNALGTIITYERGGPDGYHESVKLETG
jgi:hypothetical protein